MKGEIITIAYGRVSIPASAEIWMTQHEITDLFGCFVGKIIANVRAILKTGVLDETNACRSYHYQNVNSVEHYNPEMITALSFRTGSRNAEIYRKWLLRNSLRVEILYN